ncbi:MAG: 4-alpha-glucanotransferase, partial [Stellaceae bacterium]
MAEAKHALFDLAALAGVATRYRDAFGRERRIGEAALRAVLAAMGFAAQSPSDIAHFVAEIEAEPWRALLPPVAVLREGVGARVPLSLPARLSGGRILWSILREDGARVEGETDPASLPVFDAKGDGEHRHRRLDLPLPDLPLGYHRMFLAAGYENAACALIVAPHRGYLPPEFLDLRRWGLTAQLHSVRS